ncbi:MAG: arginine--tRNA ligase [Elusimicrobiota bacterium]|jgi:arginyl-tRNA synthetase|nr:arginine--tRNA ligase [Elusimicrobiota bacterium]
MLTKLKSKIEDRLSKDKYFAAFETLPQMNFDAAPSHIDADISTVWAMAAAKIIKKKPVDIAKKASKVIEQLEEISACAFIEPGFINIKLSDEFLVEVARDRRIKNRDGAPNNIPADKILIEFVSANPTGPLHVASGRGASLGDSLVRMHRALGITCDSEYYINDAGNQAELLGESLKARAAGKEPPENGYHGQYLIDMAAKIPSDLPQEKYGQFAMEELIKSQQADMEAFGVEFAKWFRESELHKNGAVENAIQNLKDEKNVYEKDGALWLGTSSDSDDKDRVLVRQDGRPTYFLADIAYHKNKFERGYTNLIDIWGADHHGYVARMKAAVKALGKPDNSFKVIIHQLVHLIENGEKVKMSKRAGSFITLKELTDEVGRDACRFFFASRTPNAHLNFDIGLAKKQNNENPVFYVQYVHARICSIFRSAAEKDIEPFSMTSPQNLAPQERLLLSKMLWFKKTIETCVNDLSPHHITTYLKELASLFHSFYDSCRVLDENNLEMTKSRLFTCRLVKERIAKGLELIGVSAPEQM